MEYRSLQHFQIVSCVLFCRATQSKIWPLVCICFSTVGLCMIAALIVLSLIPLYLSTNQPNTNNINTRMFYTFFYSSCYLLWWTGLFLEVISFVLVYRTNFTNVRSLAIVNLPKLADAVSGFSSFDFLSHYFVSNTAHEKPPSDRNHYYVRSIYSIISQTLWQETTNETRK